MCLLSNFWGAGIDTDRAFGPLGMSSTILVVWSFCWVFFPCSHTLGHFMAVFLFPALCIHRSLDAPVWFLVAYLLQGPSSFGDPWRLSCPIQWLLLKLLG